MGELYDLGVRVFTDDGDCVADGRVMRGAFEYARALPGAVLAQHAEDPALVRGGHMHEGAWSARLGIPGRPAEAESSIVARDLALARLTGGRYHVLHLSSAQTRRAGARGQGRRRARHRRVHAAAPRAHRRGVRGLRSGVQDEPAAARAGRRRRAARRPASTARSTRSRPTTRRTRPRPRPCRSKRRRRGCSGSRPRSRSCSRRSSSRACSRSPTAIGALSWRPARIVGPRRRTVTAARSRPAGPRTCA